MADVDSLRTDGWLLCCRIRPLGAAVKHTKGPWTIENGMICAKDRYVAKAHYEYVRYGAPARNKVEKEDDANARLIAAAPELLEACKVALDSLRAWNSIGLPSEFHKLYENSPEIKGLVKAIAKAEGK